MRPHRLAVLAWLAGSACDDGAAFQRQRVERAPSPGHAAPDVIDVLEGDTLEADTLEVETVEVDTSVAIDTADTIPDTTVEDTTVEDTTVEDAAETITPLPVGSPDDPILVTRFPFVVADDTRASASDALDRYACAAGTDESGPERVYRFDLAAAGAFVAEVDESDGVDVDVHLLAVDPASASPASVTCVARANTRLVADLEPGRYWLVVDTYVAASGPKSGAYRLALEHTALDAWQIAAIAPGITWKQKAYSSYAGGRQTINALDLDLADPRVVIRPVAGAGCRRPSSAAQLEGAVAAINAGFFDTGPGACPPLDLIKIEGTLVNGNHLTGAAQRSIGVDVEGRPIIAWVPANQDWPEAWSAIGSYPSLVTDGAVALEPDKDSDFFDGRHPRSAIGLTASGHLLLVTVEGRGPAGLGMTLAQLGQYLVDLGAVQGMNLDGGGSTTMWVRDQSLNGIVTFPSDGDGLTHTGERAVSDLLVVFSVP